MPRIPVYGGRQVEERPLPGVKVTAQASPESFGAGQARDLQTIGQGLGKVADDLFEREMRERVQFDQAQTQDAENAWMKERQDLLFGSEDPNARPGFYELPPDQADKQQGVYEQLIEQARIKHGQELKGKRAQHYYNQVTKGQTAQDRGRLKAFVVRQNERYEIDTATEQIDRMITEAEKDPMAPFKAYNAQDIAGLNVKNKILKRGSDDAKANLSLKFTDNLWDRVITRLLVSANEGDKAALGLAHDHLTNQKEAMLPAKHDKLMAMYREVSAQQQLGDILNQNMPLAETLDKIDKVFATDASTRSRARTIATQRETLRKNQLEAAYKAKLDARWKALYQNPETADPMKWMDLEADDIGRMLSWRSARLKRDREIVTDPVEMQRLENMAAFNPEKFVEEKLHNYHGAISPSDWDSLDNLQRDIKTGKGSRRTWWTDTLKDINKLGWLDEAGIDVDSEEEALYLQKIKAFVNEKIRQKEYYPELREMKEYFDFLLIEGYTPENKAYPSIGHLGVYAPGRTEGTPRRLFEAKEGDKWQPAKRPKKKVPRDAKWSMLYHAYVVENIHGIPFKGWDYKGVPLKGRTIKGVAFE